MEQLYIEPSSTVNKTSYHTEGSVITNVNSPAKLHAEYLEHTLLTESIKSIPTIPQSS